MHDPVALERARAALSFLNADDRDVWVRAGMAIKSEFGADGFDLWDAWGSTGEGHKAKTAQSVWKGMKAGGSRTIATLFYDAKSAGWKDDVKYKKPTREEIDARKKFQAERQALAAAQEAEEHAQAAQHAQRLWDAAAPATAHPYLTRKGVQAHGLRVGKWERVDDETGEVIVTTDSALLVPMRDKRRNLHSLQAIYPEANGSKLYLRQGAKRGNFHPIGKPQKDDEGRLVFVLAEGYATCASVHESTGHMALVCFDVSNLLPVAQALRESQPDAVILFAADNDTITDGNPGVTHARKAAEIVGGRVAVPVRSANPEQKCDFNDLHAAEGPEAVAAFIQAALVGPAPAEPEPEPDLEPESDPEPSDEPAEAAPLGPKLDIDPEAPDDLHAQGHFTVLGYDGDHYYFFHHGKRQVLARTKSDFSDIGLVELAPLNWWEMYYPKSGSTTGFDKLSAAQWIFALAHARGVYDPTRVRGRGAWNDKGRVVFHHGNYLTVDGKVEQITGIKSAYVYPMGRVMPALTAPPSTDEQGLYLLNVAKMVRWTMPASAALMAGWVFLSPVCGALPWRPHIWITGPAGSGKSHIQNHYCATLVRGISEYFQGNSTEPGMRQKLRADALPVLIDELEPNDDRDRLRISSILTMIRQSSSESSAETVKGTVSGHGMHFHIRSMFCAASINTMLDKDSDSSRLTQLIIRAPAQSGGDDDQWQKLDEALHLIGKDEEWPARLLARSLGMLPTILANVEVFCKAAAVRFGTQRHGDQFGTLLAGAWCLCRSTVATEAQAQKMIESYEWSEHKEEGAPDDPLKALGVVLEAKVRVQHVDLTVYELVAAACGQVASKAEITQDNAIDTLNRNGMRIVGKELVFASSSSALRDLVAKTAYATDLRGQLLRVPGANRFGNRTLKFSGIGSKCVALPLAFIFNEDEPPI